MRLEIGPLVRENTVRAPNAPERLRTAETEVDLVALSRDRKQYLIGECKFKGQPFRYGEYLDTAAKLTPLKKNAEFFYVLFSESGFDERILQEAEQNDHLQLYDMEDIVVGPDVFD